MSSSRSLSDEAKRVRVDALMAWWPFTEGSLRASIEALIEEAKRDEWTQAQEAEFLRYAEASWPARRAARIFAETHPELVWEALVPRCLPTTQVLLRRLAEREGHSRFSDLRRSPQADFAFHEAENVEFDLLMPQIFALLWREHHADMKALVDQAEAERARYKTALHGKTAPGMLSVYEHAMLYGEDLE